jgi:hypothetical protein
MRKGEVSVGSQDMKKIILSSLIALSIVCAAFAQTATPTPPATTQEDITRLEAQLKVAKLEAELAAVKGTPTPAPTPAPPTIIINNTVAPTVQQNTPPPVPAIVQNPVVVEQPPPVVIEQPVVTPPPPSHPSLMEWVVNVNDALSRHNYNYITRFTSGSINYFGHLRTSDAYIIRDMQNDAYHYFDSNSTYYPDTFTHEVSNEYSPRWSGPMIYDSITTYSETQEKGGRMHRATIRLTVGYTFVNNATTIYALVMKVL